MKVEPAVKKTGVVTLAVGGMAATFNAESAREWLELAAQYAPLILSGWLLYTMYRKEVEHNTFNRTLAVVYDELDDVKKRLEALETNDLPAINEEGEEL